MNARLNKPTSLASRELNLRPAQLKAAPRQRTSAGDDLVDRVRGEFVEMQGFSPTLAQASRLFHLPEVECQTVLTALIGEGFLLRSSDGRYRLSRHG